MTDSASSPAPGREPALAAEETAHAVPLTVLLGVFLALIALTALTVAATWVDLGSFNLLAAMGIAMVKAVLVALFFMHLAYDRPFNAFIFCVGLFFLALFVSLTLLDTVEYQPEIQKYEESLPY
ncbi:MAG: cytochrome C oxidase subunit IV family protein [Planctomycetota bacterium]|jgi:cytochrome c oxidase subunit 4